MPHLVSNQDDKQYITPFEMRTLLSIIIKNGRGGGTVLNNKMIELEKILSEIHLLWNQILQDHKNELKLKLTKIVNRFLDSDLKKSLEVDEK